MEPPKYVRGENYGIGVIYEAWIFDKELRGANPVLVVITDLPQGVAVGEQMDIPVSFDAYFFKRYRYVAGDGTRECPMLIARTLQVLATAQEADSGSMLSFT